MTIKIDTIVLESKGTIKSSLLYTVEIWDNDIYVLCLWWDAHNVTGSGLNSTCYFLYGTQDQQNDKIVLNMR